MLEQSFQPDHTLWMSGHYGVMTHWLFPGVMPEKGEPARTLDEAVDRFDVPRLLEDFAATGAEWYLLTLGQNTGYYLSPNAVIDELAGKGHCSQRDLALEIAHGVHRLGKRFIAYLPCEVAANHGLHQGFAWNTHHHTDQAEFQLRYTRAIQEWSARFGVRLDAWWFDGCYTWDVFHNRHMNWPLWLDAARAGNPERPVAFNDGNFCVGKETPVFIDQDYLSGETEMIVDGRIRLGREVPVAFASFPQSRFVPDTRCQWHSLLPIDCFWMHGARRPGWLPENPYREVPADVKSASMEPPLYADQELGFYLENCLNTGGAVTLNVGIYEEGHLGEETVCQLARLAEKM